MMSGHSECCIGCNTAGEVEVDPKTLPVDFESWNEALYSGSLVDCRVDSHMVKGLAMMTPNTHLVAGQSAWGADKGIAHRSSAALTFHFRRGDCSRIGSGRSCLAKVEFC